MPGSATLVCGAEFSEEELSCHINVKEGLSLLKCLKILVQLHGKALRGALVVYRVDSMVLLDTYNGGGSPISKELTDICKDLFWLQFYNNFELRLEYVPTGENRADKYTREDAMNDVRIDEKSFSGVWEAFGPFSFDLMASPANVVKDIGGKRLKFFSRYWTEGCEGADLFSQNIHGWSGLYCFPPTKMVGLLLQFLRESSAQCTCIFPDVKGSWYPLLLEGLVKKETLSKKGERGSFWKLKRDGSTTSVQYPFDMCVFVVDYRL